MLHYVLTILAIFSLMALWVLVQFAWRKTFPDASTDEDVLAGRGGCGGCSCSFICKKKLPFGADPDRRQSTGL